MLEEEDEREGGLEDDVEDRLEDGEGESFDGEASLSLEGEEIICAGFGCAAASGLHVLGELNLKLLLLSDFYVMILVNGKDCAHNIRVCLLMYEARQERR